MSEFSAAFILHSRPYKDTSAIIELLDETQGRVSVIAQGVKSKRSPFKGSLQPFVKLLVKHQGKSELKKLVHAEIQGPPRVLTGESLFCGFYINELLMRLLFKYDPNPEAFALYESFLSHLSLATSRSALESQLRRFEWQLLDVLGYGFSLEFDIQTQEHINEEQQYLFLSEQGFTLKLDDGQMVNRVFSGKAILAWQQGGFSSDEYRQDAKRLMRLALRPYIGDKPLVSRELFRQ